MSDPNKPIIRVVASPTDYFAKAGGGGASPPLVAVTAELREDLCRQIESAGVALAGVEGASVPVVVELREEAWAKSNRPYALLESARLDVRAAGSVGQLVVSATADSLARLSDTIANSATKAAVFQISTIKNFRTWNIEDTLQRPDWSGEVTDFQEWIDSGRRFRVIYFPWARARDDAAISIAGHQVEFLNFESVTELLSTAASSEVRHVDMEPEYSVPEELAAQGIHVVGGEVDELDMGLSAAHPVVGVIDSGIAAVALQPNVVTRIQYEISPDTDYFHGTFVGGLVSGGQFLNNGDQRFPRDKARLVDIVALPNGSVAEGVLLDRVRDAVARNREVRVWNCSFAASRPNYPAVFGPFAAALDKLSDEFNVLFVIAAGNYGSTPPCRGWPAQPHHYPHDSLAVPGESVRAVTVAAIVPTDCAVKADEPAPYSRRGPGPAFLAKPDVSHYGGGVDINGSVQGGIKSISPSSQIAESVGTSFAAPLVSAIAANLWARIEEAGGTADAALVKALLLHSAALSSPPHSTDDRHYFGRGVPRGSDQGLFCDPSAFTSMFEVDLQPGTDWDKTPFPIPPGLRTEDGKFKGELIMTLVYASPLDSAFGDEYIRHEVEASFGTFDEETQEDGSKKRVHRGKVPVDRPLGLSTREKSLLEEGLKYAPAKVYRKVYKRGIQGEQWRLKLSLTRRSDQMENFVQRAYVILTMRSVEGDASVYTDAVSLIPTDWVTTPIVMPTNVRVRN